MKRLTKVRVERIISELQGAMEVLEVNKKEFGKGNIAFVKNILESVDRALTEDI